MITRSIAYQKSVLCLLLLFNFLSAMPVLAADSPEEVKVDWQKQERVFKDNRFAANSRNAAASSGRSPEKLRMKN